MYILENDQFYINSKFISPITGYCAEYNELGARIQLHYGLRCEDVQPPCAKVYRSTEAYKCMLKIKSSWKHLSYPFTKKKNVFQF